MISTTRYTWAIVLVFSCLISTERSWGQAFQFGPAFGQDEDSIKESLMSSMKIEIDAIRRIADLPENLVKKLNIAAIQAVDAALKNNPPQRLGGRLAQPLPRAGEKLPKEGTLSDEDEEDKAKKEDEPAANANLIPGMFTQIDIKTVKKQDPWKKVLASLDPEKVAAIDAFEKKRTQELRAFRVATKVQELDDILLLSEAQKSALTEIVERILGDHLAMQPRNNGIMGGGGAMVLMIAGQVGKELPKDELKKVLSEVQFAEYESMLIRQAQGPFNAAVPPAGFGKNKKDKSEDLQNSALGFTFKEKENGLIVEMVTADSRADQAGLKSGDIIDGIDDKPVDNAIQLKRAIALNSTKSLTMNVKREGTDLKLEFLNKK